MKLLQRVDHVGRRMHLSRNTVRCYQRWVREFLVYSRLGGPLGEPLGEPGRERWREPAELGAVDVERFLTHLAVDRRVAASTQNQACNAIVFLYRQVLADELPADHLGRFVAQRAKRPSRVPTVLSENEVRRIFAVCHEALGFGPWALGRRERLGWLAAIA